MDFKIKHKMRRGKPGQTLDCISSTHRGDAENRKTIRFGFSIKFQSMKIVVNEKEIQSKNRLGQNVENVK